MLFRNLKCNRRDNNFWRCLGVGAVNKQRARKSEMFSEVSYLYLNRNEDSLLDRKTDSIEFRFVHAAADTMDNATGVVPELTNATADNRQCDRLDETRHLLLQVSNLCYAAAFLVPHKFQHSMIAVRALLSIGFLLSSVWGGLLVCAPDIMTWNLVLFFLNLGHASYLVYKQCPPRINPELLELYVKLFMPVKVKKKHFKELMRDADIQTVDPNEHYSMEGITPADQRLSVLLSGKMKATCEDVLLHYIMPYEFVDSPEWEACRSDSDKLFQVTLTATERCRLITWNRQSLEALLKTNRFLDVVIYNLIGKDITHKLYSLNEQHRTEEMKLSCTALPELWRHQMSKSLSVDAVHTGTRGRVRSITWREHDRRTSVARSESPSSPGFTPRHSLHYSDPGPVRSPNKHPQRTGANFQEEYTLPTDAK